METADAYVWKYKNRVYAFMCTGNAAEAIGAHNWLVGTEGIIETYLREHPLVQRKLAEHRRTEVVFRKMCNAEIGPEQVKINTPEHGTFVIV